MRQYFPPVSDYRLIHKLHSAPRWCAPAVHPPPLLEVLQYGSDNADILTLHPTDWNYKKERVKTHLQDRDNCDSEKFSFVRAASSENSSFELISHHSIKKDVASKFGPDSSYLLGPEKEA